MSDVLLHSDDIRTKYCGEFTTEDIGREVTVMGWCARQRDLGALIFIDLRDRSGIVQLAFKKESGEPFDIAFSVRAEYVLIAKGTVRERESKNPDIPTGDIEILVDSLRVLSKAETPPFEITEDSGVRPELRFKYRYLDLRRPDLQKNIIARAQITKITRDYFAECGFIDIETPDLIKPTPEGARDYLVPSRVQRGNFYALPQSPQIYKQLLMLSGFDKYIQIARCFRDEDLRADRQPEFTQIDLEMSFATQETVIECVEGYLKRLFKEFKDITLPDKLPRLTWQEAMDRFGSDKPDLRFGLEIIDLTETVKGCSFKVFASVAEAGGYIRGINVPGGASMGRKQIDALGEFVKTYRAGGLAWYKASQDGPSSSFAKFLSEEELSAVLEKLGTKEGDLALIIADKYFKTVCDSLGALRCHIAEKLELIPKDDYKLLWVTDFPLFEKDEETGEISPMHHPFTMPNPDDLDYLESAPEKVRSVAYDIVINGTEAGGGSVRIHDKDIQQRIFTSLGFSEEDIENKFGFLVNAFKYGAPPHAGLAFGLDRLVALLLGISDIREVIAFPKAQNAGEIMTACPAPADKSALEELGLEIMPEEKAEE